MKVAFVTPRYGTEVLGGAELGARMLAERLVRPPPATDDPAGDGAAPAGWPVEVFTTCALDARTWADAYPPGTVDVNGVQVHRFASQAGRDPGFENLSADLLAHPQAVSPSDEDRWIDLQGPVSPDLLAAVAASDADVVVFYPYLYYPTVRAIRAVAERAVMHPAAHDEPPLYLPGFQSVFGAASGFVFQTDSERKLVERVFRVAHVPQIVMGLGVEPAEGAPDDARARLGLDDRPYLLCLGRVDDGKGTGMLARFFAAYKDRHPGPLALALIGPVVDTPPPHPDVIVTGPVDERAKWGALRGALALVSPSPFEAFSLVLVEAWTAGIPVVVNGACEPTREHCLRSGGGLWFEGYGTFEAVLDRLAADPGLRADLAARGAEYAGRHFAWPTIISRYRRFLERVRPG
jgi:glycosyltransferase involved in cell wall biosynthesis